MTKIKEIKWPDRPFFKNHKTKIFVSYVRTTVLNQAKSIVDEKYPFRAGPWGGTVYSIKQREFYLNQYLWFHKEHGRFPTNERLVDEFPKSMSFPLKPYVLKPKPWFTDVDVAVIGLEREYDGIIQQARRTRTKPPYPILLRLVQIKERIKELLFEKTNR